MSDSPREPRTPLSIRVGVTGSRRIPDDAATKIRAETSAFLRLVRDQVEALASHPDALEVYAHNAQGRAPTEFRLVSPLAEGADRLAAEEALALGFSLYSPLPFARAEYEKDFSEQKEEFAKLAGQTQLFELDGGRGAEETASYEAVGQFVVRNSDLIIAIWDGQPARGRGGTAEIVHYALRAGLPVWWIEIETGTSRLLLAPLHLRRRSQPLEKDEAIRALADRIRSLVLPSETAHHDKGGIIAFLARLISRNLGQRRSPLAVYFEESNPPSLFIWSAYRAMLDLLAPRPRSKKVARMDEAQTVVEHWWDSHYRRADALSQAYADSYRSSYVLVTALAFFTFVVSYAIADVERSPLVVLEWLLLMGIGALALMNHMRHWQERWISYRLLAELCRSQLILAPIGRALPDSEVRRLAAETAPDQDVPDTARDAWVGWYFLALQRAAPCPEGDSQSSKRRAFALARSLVAEQRDYHRVRGLRAAQADHRLAVGSELSFFCVVVVVSYQLLIYLAGLPWPGGGWLQALTGGLSAVSAALVALRAYGEFALLARHSLRMREGLREVETELDSLDIAEPLASQHMGGTLHRLSILIIQEVRGWAQVFRLKTVEAG